MSRQYRGLEILLLAVATVTAIWALSARMPRPDDMHSLVPLHKQGYRGPSAQEVERAMGVADGAIEDQ